MAVLANIYWTLICHTQGWQYKDIWTYQNLYILIKPDRCPLKKMYQNKWNLPIYIQNTKYCLPAPGASSKYKDGLSRNGISIIKIRRMMIWDCLICKMGIPTLIRRHFYIYIYVAIIPTVFNVSLQVCDSFTYAAHHILSVNLECILHRMGYCVMMRRNGLIKMTSQSWL